MVPKRRAYVRIVFFFFNCFASFRGKRTSLFESFFFCFVSEYGVKGRTNTNTNTAMTIIAKICKTQPVPVFCEDQHLKCIGYVARMQNNPTKTMAPHAGSQRPGKAVDKIGK